MTKDKIDMTEVLARSFKWGRMSVESMEVIKRSKLVFVFGLSQPSDTFVYLVKYKGEPGKGKKPNDWGLLSETAKVSRVNEHFQREAIPNAMRRCLSHELRLDEGKIPPLFINSRFFLDFSFPDVGGKVSFARTCVFWVREATDLPTGTILSPEISEAKFYPVRTILDRTDPTQLREVPSTFNILNELNAGGYLEEPGSAQVRWFNHNHGITV